MKDSEPVHDELNGSVGDKGKARITGIAAEYTSTSEEFETEVIGRTVGVGRVDPGLKIETWKRRDLVMHVVHSSRKEGAAVAFMLVGGRWMFATMSCVQGQTFTYRSNFSSLDGFMKSVHAEVIAAVSRSVSAMIVTT